METRPQVEIGFKPGQEEVVGKYFDYSQRAQWLRAIVLGGIEGLAAAAFLVMGLGTFIPEPKALIFTGFVQLVAGALNTGMAAYVSVFAQVDIMKSQADRDLEMGREGLSEKVQVPSPTLVAMAASLAFVVAGAVPLLAAGLIRDQQLRISVAAAMACLSMLGLGQIAAVLGKAPVARSCARVLVGGCFEIMILLAERKALEIYGL